MKYTSLFLDLDNTLLDFSKSEEWAIVKTLKGFDLPCGSETVKLYSDINLSYWKRFERGEIPKSYIFEGRFETLLSVLNADRDIKAISDFYRENLAYTYFKIENCDEVLNYLKQKGYKLYATTNGFACTQYNRIEKSGIGAYMDKIFVSEDLGAQKPDKAYFDACINAIEEKDRSKILVVGDSQSSDILGGINAGLDTCWFNTDNAEPKYKSTYEISSLSELKNIL